MKIVIIEPLGITPEKLAEATAAVKARGHEIVAYDTKEEDQDKLAERGKDADIIALDRDLNVRAVWAMGQLVEGTNKLF